MHPLAFAEEAARVWAEDAVILGYVKTATGRLTGLESGPYRDLVMRADRKLARAGEDLALRRCSAWCSMVGWVLDEAIDETMLDESLMGTARRLLWRDYLTGKRAWLRAQLDASDGEARAWRKAHNRAHTDLSESLKVVRRYRDEIKTVMRL